MDQDGWRKIYTKKVVSFFYEKQSLGDCTLFGKRQLFFLISILVKIFYCYSMSYAVF